MCSNASDPRGKAPQARESSFTLETQEVWSQSQGPGSAAGHVVTPVGRPFHGTFASSSSYRLLLKFDHSLDILDTAAYGSPEPRTHEQDPAAGFNVAKVDVNLDRCARKRWCYSGP